jgi:hypothetical protein
VTDRLRVIVSGMVAGTPRQGGAAAAVLQYVLGLARLGHDVVLIEQYDAGEGGDPVGRFAASESARYFRTVTRELELDDRAALLLASHRETVGLGYERLERFSRDADIVLNISGMLTDERLLESVPMRVYLDLDPAFNQLWHATGVDMRFDGHTHFVTVGQAIGTPACAVPTFDLDWIPTVPPVVLAEWPLQEGPGDAFTTVGHWRAYGSIEYRGIHYGQKVHSLRRFIALPKLTDARIALALAIHSDEHDDLALLADNGWTLIDPDRVADTPATYRRFIQRSRAELGIAKSGYVESRSAWFSDRSACYLASGRPVIAQETGFSDFLPSGEGLLAFETIDDLVVGVEEIDRDYGRHSAAARSLAVERFDSDKVLSALLRRIGATG